MKIKNIILNILIAFSMLVVPFATKAETYVVKAEEAVYESYKEQLDKTIDFIIASNDNPTFFSEWRILGLARSDKTISKEYFETYINNVEATVAERIEIYDGKLDNNPTETSRLLLALNALDYDVEDINGYDLLKVLADYNYITKQGINSVMYALIALDTRNFEMPIDNNVEKQATREMYIDFLLDNEKEDGGFAWYGDVADIDLTAMTLQALAPYYDTNVEVKAVVDRGLSILSNQQTNSGGYIAWGSESSPTIAQVIIALTELGINPHTDTRFIKEGNSLIDALMMYAVDTGGFKLMLGGKVDLGMSTEQAVHALVAYDRFIHDQASLYDMSDLDNKTETPTPEDNEDSDNETIEYEILDDVKEKFTKDEDIIIRVNGNIEDFVELKLNGKVVDKKHYTIKEGSVVITLLKSYIQTLEEKTHLLEINFVNGSISKNLNIVSQVSTDEQTQEEKIIEANEKSDTTPKETIEDKDNNEFKTNHQTSTDHEVLPQTGSVSLFLISAVFMLLGTSILHLNKKD